MTSERGTALLETAMTLPLVLLLSVGIFEFGRAYQLQQVLTNAAREGARLAVTPSSTTAQVQTRVQNYLLSGQVPNYASATVTVTAPVDISIGGGVTAPGTQVTVTYPFSFVVLNPVVRLIQKDSTLGNGVVTMTASAVMRNE